MPIIQPTNLTLNLGIYNQSLHQLQDCCDKTLYCSPYHQWQRGYDHKICHLHKMENPSIQSYCL